MIFNVRVEGRRLRCINYGSEISKLMISDSIEERNVGTLLLISSMMMLNAALENIAKLVLRHKVLRFALRPCLSVHLLMCINLNFKTIENLHNH